MTLLARQNTKKRKVEHYVSVMRNQKVCKIGKPKKRKERKQIEEENIHRKGIYNRIMMRPSCVLIL